MVRENNPVTVALNNVVNTSTGVKEYNVDMAAAIIAALPTLAVFVVAGAWFVRGLAAGAVKGYLLPPRLSANRSPKGPRAPRASDSTFCLALMLRLSRAERPIRVAWARANGDSEGRSQTYLLQNRRLRA